MTTLVLTLFVFSVLLNAFLLGQYFKVCEHRNKLEARMRQYPVARRVLRNQLN